MAHPDEALAMMADVIAQASLAAILAAGSLALILSRF